MKFSRTLYIITYPNRLRHRMGYGVQSPWAFEVVRDVLFEKCGYYAYEELGLRTSADRQLWRIKNFFGKEHFYYASPTDKASERYEELALRSDAADVLVIDGIMGSHYALWQTILHDSRSTVTFELYNRALITFDKKRIKQNYTL